jgi:hypothetical protein
MQRVSSQWHDKNPMVYLSYLTLTPGYTNLFSSGTHKTILEKLRTYFPNWLGFIDKHQGYSLGFIIVTKKGIEQLEVKGPSISKKMKVVDFSIFLPDKIENLKHYLDLVFQGISISLSKYKIAEIEILKMRTECAKEFGVV